MSRKNTVSNYCLKTFCIIPAFAMRASSETSLAKNLAVNYARHLMLSDLIKGWSDIKKLFSGDLKRLLLYIEHKRSWFDSKCGFASRMV
jgi:hypothetical protein